MCPGNTRGPGCRLGIGSKENMQWVLEDTNKTKHLKDRLCPDCEKGEPPKWDHINIVRNAQIPPTAAFM